MCYLAGVSRAGYYRRLVETEPDEAEMALRTAIQEIVLAHHRRYGYRRVTALLHREGWQVNHKRVERIWRQEGLKVPQKQPKRRRLWLANGSCVRLRPLTGITSGAMTSSRIERPMLGRSGCW